MWLQNLKLVSDSKEQRTPVEAQYESINRLKITKPASYSWLAKVDKSKKNGVATGRAACLVDRPAKFAEYTRKVVKTAGRFERKRIPAKTREVEVEALVSQAKSVEFKENAVVKQVDRRVMVSDARIEWQPVLCEVNMSKDIIVSLQKALSKRGYQPGPVDGVMGRGTMGAIRKFQKDNKMANGGLTIEMLDKLGIKL